MKVLSLGAGVNSTALLVLKAQGKVDFDLAIFADTGAEHPETYEYIEKIIKPLCKNNNINLVVTRKEGKNLVEDNMERKIIPTRMFRSCTDKFKIRAIRKYLVNNYPDEQITFLLGIDSGETQRAKDNCGNTYPLIELGLDREGCKRVIRDYGLPIPIKSGCFICPFTKPENWPKLLKEHPDLFAIAETLEKNGSRFPEMVLSFDNISLERIRKGVRDQQKMCNWLPTCAMCEIEDNSDSETLCIETKQSGGS